MATTFEAKYDGWCPACWERIRVGDMLCLSSEDKLVAIHADCEDLVDIRATEACAKCFIQKPCPCEDGQ